MLIQIKTMLINLFINIENFFGYDLEIFYLLFNKICLPGVLILLTYYFFFYTHPINPLLAFIVICVLFLIYLFVLNVHFLALIFAIIYIGAILILFLFVLMLFRKMQTFYQKTYVSIEWVFFLIISFFYTTQTLKQFSLWLFFVTGKEEKNLIISQLHNSKIEESNFFLINYPVKNNYIDYKTYIVSIIDKNISSNLIKSNIEIFVNYLYGTYGFLFLISGVILLVSMVGAITIIFLVKNKEFQNTKYSSMLSSLIFYLSSNDPNKQGETKKNDYELVEEISKLAIENEKLKTQIETLQQTTELNQWLLTISLLSALVFFSIFLRSYKPDLPPDSPS